MHADCTLKNKGLYRMRTVHINNLKWTQSTQILNKADLTATVSYNTPHLTKMINHINYIQAMTMNHAVWHAQVEIHR